MLKFQLQAGQLNYESLIQLVTARANEQAMRSLAAVAT